MIAELGLMCLILAFALALIQALALLRPLAGNMLGLAGMQAALVGAALVLLIVCRVTSDFTVGNVAQHSSLALPLVYKIAGAWGNHEGSLVLMIFVLSLFGALLAGSPNAWTPRALGMQALLAAAFLLFLLLTSNPFARIFPPPEDGATLNPLLQDIGLILHPPLLYVGYMGFSVVFALAVSALAEGRLGREWAAAAHPWIMGAWSFLTLGIALGSWWAYRELGWGGFWFWDPVENASLLPWLAGTALLHANAVLMRRGALSHWVLLLAILTFGMSLIGTFLVRSGVVTSVHSFASDPARGLFIMGFFVVFCGGALALYSCRAGRIESETRAMPLSREGLMVLNGLLFALMLAIVLLGTLYPIVSQALMDMPLTVGPPYFNRMFLPVMAAAATLASVAPLVAWQRDAGRRVLRALRFPALAALAAAVLVAACTQRETVAAAAGIGLSVWLLAGTVLYALKPGKRKAATVLAHAGAALVVAGVTGMGLWQAQGEAVLHAGEEIHLADWRFALREVASVRRQNHVSKQAVVDVYAHDRKVSTLMPEYRLYDIANIPTSEASLDARWWGDIYAVGGETPPGDEAAAGVRVYLNPLSHLLWLGALLMAAGGVAGLMRRRDVA